MAKLIYLGLAKPDDPAYSCGLIVKGKQFRDFKQSTPEQNKPASLDLARATRQVSAAMEFQGPEAVEED